LCSHGAEPFGNWQYFAEFGVLTILLHYILVLTTLKSRNGVK